MSEQVFRSMDLERINRDLEDQIAEPLHLTREGITYAILMVGLHGVAEIEESPGIDEVEPTDAEIERLSIVGRTQAYRQVEESRSWSLRGFQRSGESKRTWSRTVSNGSRRSRIRIARDSTAQKESEERMEHTGTQREETALVPGGAAQRPTWLVEAARVANEKARDGILERYLETCSAQTIRRHQAAIALFEHYLEEAKKSVEAYRALPPLQHLCDDLAQWTSISFGLVEGFREWLKNDGYAIGTINVRLDSVKMFCTLAMQAGYLATDEHARIYRVRKIRPSEGRNIDEKRTRTRKEGSKKVRPNLVDPLLHRRLKETLLSDGSDLALRDLLLVCFLADHGLREGEVAGLPADCIDLERGTFTFYRHKVHKTQTHWLSDDTAMAARLYFGRFHPTRRLFEGDPRKGKMREDGQVYQGKTREDGYDETSIYVRIRELGRRYLTKTLPNGRQVPLDNLSPHDLRHSWATEQARKKGVNIKALQDAGGWSNPITPLGYIVSNEIANDELIDLPPAQPRSRRNTAAP